MRDLATADAAPPPVGGWVSPGVVELRGRELGFARGLTLQDPDGHVVQLREPASALEPDRS